LREKIIWQEFTLNAASSEEIPRLVLSDMVDFLQMGLGDLLRAAHFSADSAPPGCREPLDEASI
jgi:hypothetical protein